MGGVEGNLYCFGGISGYCGLNPSTLKRKEKSRSDLSNIHRNFSVAQNLSLAILELIVHLDEDSDITSFVAIPVTFDWSLVHILPQSQLPKNWFDLPISEQSQMVGKKWLEPKQSLLLQVPSSVVPSESNFLINPLHPKFAQLEIGSTQPLFIDQRISKLLH